jgi:hypothetical protein
VSTSLEKVNDFMADLAGAPKPDADALELGLATLVQMTGPMFESLLPDDPAVLDDYLEKVAHAVLGMRSDGSHQLLIHPMQDVVDAEVLQEQRELNP